jgi:hypothetical protein
MPRRVTLFLLTVLGIGCLWITLFASGPRVTNTPLMYVVGPLIYILPFCNALVIFLFMLKTRLFPDSLDYLLLRIAASLISSIVFTVIWIITFLALSYIIIRPLSE